MDQAVAPRRVARAHTRVAWAVAVATVAALVLAVTAGRPQLTWSLDPTTNLVTITAVPGSGPLATGMAARAVLSSGGAEGSVIRVPVPPGRTTRIPVRVDSGWPTTEYVTVDAPAAPAIADSVLGPRTLLVRFTLPVVALNQPCGLLPGTSYSTYLAFPRGLAWCSNVLFVSATSGEMAELVLMVAPLAPTIPMYHGRAQPPAPPGLPPAPALYFAPADKGAIYITIDDGDTPDPAVIQLMQSRRVPVTAFITANLAKLHLDYWRQFVAAGGDVENHTVSHPEMLQLSAAADLAEWANASQSLYGWLGIRPALGRPPYGDFNGAVQTAAGKAGLRYLVLWSATMYNGTLTTYDHGPLRAGEIVLLHWIPGMYASLVKLLDIAARLGLHPAPLRASLGV